MIRIGILAALAAFGSTAGAAQSAVSESAERSTVPVVSSIDIRHLRAIADTLNLETVAEDEKPNDVLLAVRVPRRPIFNLLATTCRSLDQTSDCKSMIVRTIFDAELGPFNPAQVNRVNARYPEGKAVLLNDGRLRYDRLVIVSDGVTMGNLVSNVRDFYATLPGVTDYLLGRSTSN